MAIAKITTILVLLLTLTDAFNLTSRCLKYGDAYPVDEIGTASSNEG